MTDNKNPYSPAPKPQAIYDISLDKPTLGYAATSTFREAVVVCPKCKGRCWIRVRFRYGSTLGIVCEDCNWRATFPQKPDLHAEPITITKSLL